MDETNSFLVPFEMTDIGRGADPYPAEAKWAEPDVEAAADLMQAVVRDAQCATERGKRAAEDIARLHSPRARAPFLIERLTAITRDLPGTDVMDDPAPPKGETRPRIVAEEPITRAHAAVASRPDVASPARYERLSRPIRRTIARLLRHYDDHRMKADTALLAALEAIREETHLLEANVGDEIQKLFRLERRTDVLERRDGELQDQLADLTERMRTLEGQLRRERRLRRDLIERVQRLERTDVRDDPPAG
jgi:hypothetical protein